MKKITALSFTLCLFFIAACIALLIGKEKWLQTDLRALLPEQKGWQDVQVLADQRQEVQFNQQVIIALGHPDPKQAFKLTTEIAQRWRESQLFKKVEDKNLPDLAQLRQEIQALKLATLPSAVQNELLNHPETYFQHYAEQLINPFDRQNLLPLQDDWLGFGRFVLSSMPAAKLQWNAENGMIYANQTGMTWVLLRGELAQSEMMNPAQSLVQLIAENRQFAQNQSAQFLAIAPALFSADAKQKAEKESNVMATLGIGLTLLLLLWVFRTWRIVWLFLPILVGMLGGVCAVILFFGQVHILTLVVGTSLVGVLIDFPLHWLASSLFSRHWHAHLAMKNLRLTFLVSLAVTLLGYALLAVTALPILKQTALFSIVALVCAILTTMNLLPPLFRQWQGNAGKSIRKVRLILTRIMKKSPPKWCYWIVGLFALTGLYQTQWRDDIRQWVSLPDAMLQEAQQIGQIAGINLNSQYFLLTADNDEALLEKDRQLSQTLQSQGVTFQSLSQWIMSEHQQQDFTQKLTALSPANYAVMSDIGIEPNYITQSIHDLAKIPPLSLQAALQTQIGQGWQALYLGQLNQSVASIIRINATQAPLADLANNQDIFWQDKRAHLNEAFQATRDQAAWLKLFSFGLAGGFLWFFWGLKRSLKMLYPPLLAIMFTLSIFGWLGIPVGLFSLFGLLLVSAIGVDYTAYMQTAQETLSHKRIAILLAALTTLISFFLLSISTTPAVAAFGIAVSLGVLLSVLITLKIFK